MKEIQIKRRDFVKLAAVVAAGANVLADVQQPAGESNARLLKAIQFHMMPKELGDAEKFKLAKDCGFDGIEINYDAGMDEKAAGQFGRQAIEQGLPVHSVVFGGWQCPFSDPNSEVIAKGLDGMKKALHNAKAIGADAVLLVPAIVTEKVGYADAYKRSQENIHKLIPLAGQLEVVIAVENVWNKFLLSPIEFARYIDELDSPWVKAYFDVGNVIIFGFAQDWITTLGPRIKKIHLKDFKRDGYKWTNLLDGDINWSQVRKAISRAGYTGYMTAELPAGDRAYLEDLSLRMKKIIDL